MGIFSFFGIGKPNEKVEVINEPKSGLNYAETEVYGGAGGYYGASYPIITKVFDGEKTPGDLGVVTKNIPDYMRLRLRGLDAYVKTDAIKLLTNRRVQWVIGNGMKLECEPEKDVLKLSGITITTEFQKQVEALWKVYSNSKRCDYESRRNLHEIAKDCYSDKFKTGDALVVCRIEKHGPTVQLISGEFVQTPLHGNEVLDKKGKDNTIIHGIEYNQRGEQVAYYVRTNVVGQVSLKYERIEAYGKNYKRRMAWMVYGQKLTSDQKRGVPEFTQVIEKVLKLDRYVGASVGKAEQAANILFGIEHKEYSDGSNPLQDIANRRLTGEAGKKDAIDSYKLGDGLANKITRTTSNQTFNLPPGASLKDFGTDIETSFADFHEKNQDDIFSSCDTPPEVAKQKYNSNYSASRAAINSWGYIVDIDRNDFANQFYKPFYALWFEFQVLTNKINADGFVKALISDDFMVFEAYLQCRFVGRNMPHIDPLKEVKAIREALGDDRTPLISREQATEGLGFGDFHENIQEYNEENNKFNLVQDDNTETNDNQ